MTTMLRPWLTKAVRDLGAASGVEMPHREGIARIADRYSWGVRPDTDAGSGMGQRHWSEKEAHALVNVCRLRNLGLEWELIDQLVTSGPQIFVAEVESALSVIREVGSAA